LSDERSDRARKKAVILALILAVNLIHRNIAGMQVLVRVSEDYNFEKS